MAAVATPPPAPCTSTVSPGFRPDFVTSIRYAVIETVGEATWAHSLRALRPGGTIVVSGSTSGPNPPADLARVFFLQLNVVGSTMGTREELEALVALLVESGVRPTIDAVFDLRDARSAFERLASGDVVGKIVLTDA